MKNKAPLVLMEQMIMLLVFALAAALCMQAFVKSDSLSKGSEARDGAVLAAQSAAETLRNYAGDWEKAAEYLQADRFDDASLTVTYDQDWQSGGTAYTLEAQAVETEFEGLGKAEIRISSGEETLISLEVAWQEVIPDGG